MNLEGDLRREILRYLPALGSSDAALARDLPTDGLLIRFINWRDRLVHSHPRKVEKSREMLTNPLYLARRNDVNLIFAKAAIGQDLGPHLSRNIKSGYEAPAPKPGRDLDLLLNEWGIHHLHFSSTIEADGFVERGGDVLFAIFRPGLVYAIDIMTHSDWANSRLVEIAVTNWPTANLFRPLNAVTGFPDSASDRTKLRGAGINTFVAVKGVPYISDTFGLTSARTTFHASRRAGEILGRLGRYIRDPDSIERDFKVGARPGLIWPRVPRFSVQSAVLGQDFAFVIKEEETGNLLRLE